MKHFVLIDHILSETICLFCFCVWFSNIYPKIKFMAKNWSDLCNFYKVMFWNSCLRKYFFYFSLMNLCIHFYYMGKSKNIQCFKNHICDGPNFQIRRFINFDQEF